MSQNASYVVIRTFVLTHLHAFSPRVDKFAGDFVCTLPDPSAATTTAAAFIGLERAAFGTSGRSYERDGFRKAVSSPGCRRQTQERGYNAQYKWTMRMKLRRVQRLSRLRSRNKT